MMQIIMLNEISETPKVKHYIFSLICGSFYRESIEILWMSYHSVYQYCFLEPYQAHDSISIIPHIMIIMKDTSLCDMSVSVQEKILHMYLFYI